MKVKKTFEQIFAFRAGVCYFIILSLLLSCILRVAAINMKDYSALQSKTNSIKIEIEKPRGSILDKNGIPLTNSKMRHIAAVMPTKSAIAAVKSNLSGEEKIRVLSLLQSGKPAVCEMEKEIECDGIAFLNLPVRVTENTVAHHIIGYLNSENKGAYGIEKAYDSLLSCPDDLCAVFPSGGNGNLLLGVSPEFSGNTDNVSNAVYLTLDINIQKAVEKASCGLKSGAVIVSETKTNKIRAMLSLPDFSPYDISGSLESENSPLLNKCLESYNIGSAFKPCIAAAAIKEGRQQDTYNCTGNTSFESRVFNCHKRDGHGTTDLKSALKNSCNCYFYNLAVTLGAEKIFKSAEYMNFGSKIKIADGIYSSAGNLPAAKSLKSKSDIANFGIGQGDILLSPVGMLTLYSAIANKGEYYLPSIVEKTSKGGKEEEYNIGCPTRVMTEKESEIITEALISVVNEGTGTAAKSEKVSLAGKTATAQTGRFKENGTEITNSWFCGFFPAESPKYTVIVMSDGEYEKSPAEIFKDIGEALSIS